MRMHFEQSHLFNILCDIYESDNAKELSHIGAVEKKNTTENRIEATIKQPIECINASIQHQFRRANLCFC